MVEAPKAATSLALLSWILVCATSVAGDCGGHGTRIEGKCQCDNPSPSQAGEAGYVGEECEIRTFGVQINGDDVTQTCSSSGCNTLKPEEWVCLYSPVTWNGSDAVWNYLTVQLNRTSAEEDGDPDLYGMFLGNGSDAKMPIAETYEYDFRETSSSSHRSVVQKVKKKDYTDKAYQGVYLCVKAYGEANVTFSLRASLSKCPEDFSSEGERIECSTPVSASEKRHTGCTDDGVCLCKPPYTKPLPQTYEGLGFEECAARVSNIPDVEFRDAHTYIAEHELVGIRAWNFYAFNVSQQDYQVVINVAGETETDDQCSKFGYFSAFAKFGQPPGWHYGQWDFRPQWDYYHEDDSDLKIAFDQTQEEFQPGEWYVGVNGDDSSECKYTLTISTYECPMNCTGQGSCHVESNGTRTCHCNKGYFGIDCANQAAALEYGSLVQKEETAFEYEYYQLPPITPAMLTHSVEVRFLASFSSSTYGMLTAAKPELLLLEGDNASYPTAGNYTFKAALETQNQSYHLDLCPSQLKQGQWRAAIYNPMRIYKVAYNLTVMKQGICLNNCSSHGTCTEDGVCECSANWAGGDCSIDTSASTCQQGSHMPSDRPEEKGTCWRECSCDGSGNCRYQDACADFTCTSASLRRKGSEDQCVQDACTHDEWEDTEVHSCMRKCICPEDGSSCSLAASCSADSFSCKQGYRRFSDQTARCYPVGCQQGAMQEALRGSLDNGKAYAVCLCGSSDEEREDEPLCKTQSTDLDQMAVVCDDGFSRKLLAGGAGGIALLWFYERKLRPANHNNGLYHELSMDTGF